MVSNPNVIFSYEFYYITWFRVFILFGCLMAECKQSYFKILSSYIIPKLFFPQKWNDLIRSFHVQWNHCVDLLAHWLPKSVHFNLKSMYNGMSAHGLFICSDKKIWITPRYSLFLKMLCIKFCREGLSVKSLECFSSQYNLNQFQTLRNADRVSSKNFKDN